jgi:hypothetical protein
MTGMHKSSQQNGIIDNTSLQANILVQVENLKALAEKPMTAEVATKSLMLTREIAGSFEAIQRGSRASNDRSLTQELFDFEFAAYRARLSALSSAQDIDPDIFDLSDWLSDLENMLVSVGYMFDYVEALPVDEVLSRETGEVLGIIYKTACGRQMLDSFTERQ